MANVSIPDLKNDGADEAVLKALLDDAKEDSGEAGLEALLAGTDKQVAEKSPVRKSEQEQDNRLEGRLSKDVGQAKDVRQAKADRASAADTAKKPAAQPVLKASTDKPQMLIVHADLTQLSVLEMSFISEGYDVVTFETGKEALQFLKTNVPDIMILDADMEKLTGMDICFRIRKIKRFETVPVIIMTESVDDRTETMVKMCHANDFFPKANKNIELKAKVRKLVKQ